MTIDCKKPIIIFLISLFLVNNIFSENFSDTNHGYSLDLPEGFSITDMSNEKDSFLFEHSSFPVSLIIKINTSESTSEEVLNSNLTKFKASYQIDLFKWNNKTCAISNFTSTLDKKYSGWAFCCELVNKNEYITLLCYTPIENEQVCQQFILSTINSLCVDFELYNTPGCIVSYAYPKEGNKNITLKINDISINSTIDKIDEEALQFLIEMEYGVLTLYARHNLWKEAWQRYYRLIYRDSYERITPIANKIYLTLYPEAKKIDNKNPEIKYAQMLLSWVQSFNYERNTVGKSDFTNIISAMLGKGSDCDSRSLLICSLLKYIGIESLLLVSMEYSHAMVATEIEAPGQVYELENSNRYFIYGETTAKVTWGMIDKSMTDKSKWIPVILP